MEHALHIAAKHFIEKVIQDDIAGHRDNLRLKMDSDSDPNSDDNSKDQGFEPGDALGKAIVLIKQVSLFLFSVSVLT